MCIPAQRGETEPVDRLRAADFTSVPNATNYVMYDSVAAILDENLWFIPNERAAVTSHEVHRDYTPSNHIIVCGIYPHNSGRVETTDWTLVDLPIECRPTPIEHDPFEDGDSGPRSSSDRGQDVLSQISRCAVLVFDYQQRTHLFTLLVLGCMARILRWDRAGLLVSHKFDYTKKPEYLARFLWRFGRMTPEERGHDPTAKRILPGTADYILMHYRAETPVIASEGTVVGEHAREMLKKSLLIQPTAKDQTQPPAAFGPAALWRLTVHDSIRPRTFLVGLPHTTSGALTGRGTRTYVAIDLAHKDGPLVYLKDAWRAVDYEGIEQEGKILALLKSESGEGPVEGVPTLRCHGDVEGQVTRTQEAWRLKHPNAKLQDCPLKTHRHYRLVVEEVCRPMHDFPTFFELVGMLLDCMDGTSDLDVREDYLLSVATAHRNAYTRKHLLHRDISAGNVLIYPKQVEVDGKIGEKWVGLLADWELAKQVAKPNAQDAPRQLDRIGTWQFTSASALANPSKRIIVQDDMESFFHLMLYFALRYLPSNCEDIGEYMSSYFNGCVQEDGVYYGGEKKLSAMLDGKLTTLLLVQLKFYKPGLRSQPSEEDTSSSATQAYHDQLPQATPARTSAEHACPDTTGSSTPQVPTVPLEPHPINAIFSEFLTHIKAHYALHYIHREERTSNSAPETHPTITPKFSTTDVGNRLRNPPLLPLW
ncbi:hypothetical protein FKP32DRAFT_1604275 [Trametes sanguinea]|nr:hypothetical protein FKP32DRAFT_1604275 [Trametes sanguinea]